VGILRLDLVLIMNDLPMTWFKSCSAATAAACIITGTCYRVLNCLAFFVEEATERCRPTNCSYSHFHELSDSSEDIREQLRPDH